VPFSMSRLCMLNIPRSSPKTATAEKYRSRDPGAPIKRSRSDQLYRRRPCQAQRQRLYRANISRVVLAIVKRAPRVARSAYATGLDKSKIKTYVALLRAIRGLPNDFGKAHRFNLEDDHPLEANRKRTFCVESEHNTAQRH
jgi:hypothetical protein